MNAGALAAARSGQVPFGDEFYVERNGAPLLVKKQVVLTGDRLTDAQPGFDNQTHEPAVHLTLDATGARIFKEYTRENVGKRDRKSTRLNSSHLGISYAVFCLKKKKHHKTHNT